MNRSLIIMKRDNIQKARETLRDLIFDLDNVNNWSGKYKEDFNTLEALSTKLYNDFIEVDLILQEKDHQLVLQGKL